MPKTLTLKRSSPRDPIIVPLWAFDPVSKNGKQIATQLDTGNDHTCVRKDVLDAIGAKATGKPVVVHGVTGSARARVATLMFRLDMDRGGQVQINNHEVAVVPSLSCEALLGRDFLEFFDVTISRDGTTILTCD